MRSFSQSLLNWYRKHGRHDLPWQQDRSLYSVWISEIMLQQTQVKTVIPYFNQFMTRFTNIESLANAVIDDVLHLWTGLGYYARARNLHRAAQYIRDEYACNFPTEFEQVLALPGIGRSTAGAILAQSLNQRYPILDGNVKRVLTRFHGIEGWPGNALIEKNLWQLADAATPDKNCDQYTQAIMDLGATLCTRTKPNCTVCPLSKQCQAFAQGNPTAYPTPKPRKKRPRRKTIMLLLRNESNQLLLELRPPVGIWGGLWSFPECPIETDISDWCRHKLNCKIKQIQQLEPMRHSFSHFHLDIQPIHIQATPLQQTVMDTNNWIWYDQQAPVRGFPAPVKYLLDTHQD